MGNTTSKGDRGWKRTFSYRRPKAKTGNLNNRTTKDDSCLITHQQIEEQETTNTESCVQSLHKNVAQLRADLESLDKAAREEKKKIDGLVQLLLDNTKEQDDESKDEIIPRLTKVMNDVAANLKEIQIRSQHFNGLKLSFSTVSRDIKDLEQLGKDVTIKYNHNDKHAFEEFGDICSTKQKPEKKVKRPKLQVTKVELAKTKMQLNEIQQANISAPVQLFYIHESGVITEIVKELKSMLNRKLETVNFIHCSNASDIDQEKLLIIVCIATTRLGADAARAVKDIRNPDNAALLIIHVTEAHCLTKQKSSRHLFDKGFKNLRGIFDMAFKSGNGFFHCDMNVKSLNGLSLFCQQHAYGEKL